MNTAFESGIAGSHAASVPFDASSVASAVVRRISAHDTNYFVLLFDPENDATDPVGVIEIFEVGGATPPNQHLRAREFFYVLAGEAIVCCEGIDRRMTKGDALMVRPGREHVVENIGSTKLYTLTFMVPNEGFAQLVRAGEHLSLDDEDRAVLLGSAS